MSSLESGNFGDHCGKVETLEIIADSRNSGDGNFGNLRRVGKLHFAFGDHCGFGKLW
jgi:hypothetical protein